MKRVAELIIILSTLAAIVSTFFLYRSHLFSPQLTANVIMSDETTLRDSGIETVSTQELHISTSTPTTTSSAEASESNQETPPQTIVIEKLPVTAAEIETLVTKIHSLTNLSRSQNKLPAYILDSSLSTIAKRRSEEMVRENYFSHTSPAGCDLACQMKKSGYQTTTWGENLALSNNYHLYTTPELAQTFITDWLKSSTHRDNVLSRKFTHHGIGIASEGEKIIVTVVFAAP